MEYKIVNYEMTPVLTRLHHKQQSELPKDYMLTPLQILECMKLHYRIMITLLHIQTPAVVILHPISQAFG